MRSRGGRYLARQIRQFQQMGAEFAMQHLGTEDELEQAVLDLMAALPPEKRLAGLSAKELLAGLSPEVKEALRKRLQGGEPPAPAK